MLIYHFFLTILFVGDILPRMGTGTAQRMVEVVSDAGRAGALLDPVRLRLVESLDDPGDSAAGLARRLGLPRQKVNYHLRELEKLGLVELIDERRKGNCIERIVRRKASTYIVDPALLGRVGADPARSGDRFSATFLASVGARIVRELSELIRRSSRAGKQLSTLTIDSEVRFASAKKQAEFGEELSRRLGELVSEYHNESAPGGRTFRVIACAYQAITKPENPLPGDGPTDTPEHHHD